MERVRVLIDRLVEQKANNEPPAKMLLTVQLLQSELLQLQQKSNAPGTAKVAVRMPTQNVSYANDTTEPSAAPQTEKFTPEEKPAPVIPLMHREAKREEPAKTETPPSRKPALQPVPPAEEIREAMPFQKPAYTTFDAMTETPTLLHQTPPRKEVHEVIGEKKESLNDKLKQERTEVAHVLKESPIKDLRKAIGINDKFLFVNELFRGDEGMYERSIKTINNFQILPEAEYWINRELKVKLGWNDSKDLVQHFYQLVRRRFS